ncbi:hypothetical protein PS862_00249 [Pseudomonas fluorescens]|uniref:Phage tail fibre protein N-terminal domain-containing protein n=1 Tax=Pseudomonas fluorescens TaxID=294 RepID=A0A5E7GG16_PSEFL|nr:phage tail protein [Pseudomonas fluorescens]VVO49752.1 hypothetical protein PS862_00249 [Pseudomonas fluorescens]
MAEQDILYIAMLTDVGAAQLAKSVANGTNWNITHMSVGDGNGVTPIPSKLQKTLIHENLRLPLNRLTVRADRPVIVAELILPPNVGGWWVREVGLHDSTGALVAVANYPAAFKPPLAQGSGRTLGIRVQILVSSTANIVLIDDPSLVMATLSTVREEIAKGEAGSAVKLKTPRTISLTGDGTGQAVFDGTASPTIALTLADTGVAPGAYSKVTINAKGLVTGGGPLAAGDIPALDASKITTGTLSRPTTGNAGSATQWQSGRYLSFSGAASGGAWLNGATDVNVPLTLNGFDASKVISGALAMQRGGTGGWDAPSARASLGAASPALLWHSANGFWWDKNTGLFVQWGVVHLGDMPGGMWNVPFGFTWGFDTAPFIVLPVITQLGGGNVAAATVTCAMNEGSLTTSGFTLSFTEYDGNVQNFGVRWLAVGYRLSPM